MAEDQRPAHHYVERNGAQHDDEAPDRPFQRGDEIAQRGKAQEGQQRPLQAVHQMAGLPRQIGILPHGEQDRLTFPQQQPGRQHEEEGGAQRLLNGAAHIAHAVAATAALAGDQGGGGGDEPHAEQQQRMEQVDGQRAGRDRLRPDAAEQQQIGRGDRRPGDIARDHRQRQRDQRAGLDTPGGSMSHFGQSGKGTEGELSVP